MSDAIEISDDEDWENITDDSIVTWNGDKSANSNQNNYDISMLSDDDELDKLHTDKDTLDQANVDLLSSDDELPSVNLKQIKTTYIKKLFPNNVKASTSKDDTQLKVLNQPKSFASQTIQTKSKNKGVIKMIGGVEVCLPVSPYGSQIALMAKIIEAMKKGKNCLLESPTGSGKTLALLCGALACQLQEKNLIAKNLAEGFVEEHQQLKKLDGASQFISTPKKEAVPPEQLFTNIKFGSKSIYDQPSEKPGTGGIKRIQDTRSNSSEESNTGQVWIHKKPRSDSPFKNCSNSNTPTKSSNHEAAQQCTPEKPIDEKLATPGEVSTPTIYYGARTHKQLEQVIKEFGRTWYSGQSNMTLLSSREYSCIREFDKKLWGTKNDMCRGCVKAYKENAGNNKKESNCKFYDNRLALNRRTLPPVFDLEDLVTKGKEINACPFYAARALETDADIVFCPYNYLIDPSIRDSLQIKLEGNILIIDEAHNIEDICRDSATYTVSKEQVASGIKELQIVHSYRYQNQNNMSFVETLLKSLLNFEQWFTNQIPLVKDKPVVNGEASYKWDVQHFVQTLNNHNIGQAHYQELCRCAEILSRMHRDNPRAVLGATQSTVTLLTNIATALGYLFRDSGKHINDFKPIFTRQVTGDLDNSHTWRNSQFKKAIDSETYSLKFLCLNPAVVFESLKCAKSIILASGTLTPMISFHSELDTEFALKVSPNHVIPRDRVWIGTLRSGLKGDLTCTSRNMENCSTQDDLGLAVTRVCEVTPHGVLCFMPSYRILNILVNRWRQTSRWKHLEQLKYIYQESRNVHDHNEIMEKFQERVCEDKGALLLAVYRGKVSEGMDFRDRQARAVITIGIPFPNTYDVAVTEKKLYNNKYAIERNLLAGDEWLKVQAYRALNQAVGRCVRHREDWGAVLMIDARFTNENYTMYLSQWVRNFLGCNHHTIESLIDSSNGLNNFMQSMTLNDDNTD